MNGQYKKINEIMEFLQDSFIEEALEEEHRKIHRFPLRKCIIAAACAGILIISSRWFIKDYTFNGITSKKAGTDTENIPAIKYEKDIKDKDRLEKIVCGLQTDGAGGGEHGWLLIKSIADVTSKNPTRNNAGRIKELPVFKKDRKSVV